MESDGERLFPVTLRKAYSGIIFEQRPQRSKGMKSLQISWGRNSSVLEEAQRACSGGGWGTLGPERPVWLQWKEHWVEQQVVDDLREAKGTHPVRISGLGEKVFLLPKIF